MASTYTTGFSLEKIGSGEQSGTWGTTSNHNLDIVDRLASYKAVAITTNADTATQTVREASPGSGTENLQDGMYRAIKFTGALDSNCTVTIAPNTAPAWFIIENATTDSGSSGPYSIILSQGSGANVTVLNGKNAMVYCDGAGSGAAVVNALADVNFTSLMTTTAGTSNFVAGVNAGNSIESGGNYNVAVGDEAGTAITTGDNNVFVGYGSGDATTTPSSNVAVGYNALSTNTTGASNVAVGVGALFANTTAGNNTALGESALNANTTGTLNVAVGPSAKRLIPQQIITMLLAVQPLMQIQRELLI